MAPSTPLQSRRQVIWWIETLWQSLHWFLSYPHHPWCCSPAYNRIYAAGLLQLAQVWELINDFEFWMIFQSPAPSLASFFLLVPLLPYSDVLHRLSWSLYSRRSGILYRGKNLWWSTYLGWLISLSQCPLGLGDLGCISSLPGYTLTPKLNVLPCSHLILPANSEIAALLSFQCMSANQAKKFALGQ